MDEWCMFLKFTFTFVLSLIMGASHHMTGRMNTVVHNSGKYCVSFRHSGGCGTLSITLISHKMRV